MSRLKGMRGFTLLELMVVVAILGILAAIAISGFSAHRRRAFDSRAKNDLGNAAMAEEAYYAQAQTYVSDTCTNAGGYGILMGGQNCSKTVTVTMQATTGEHPTFTGTARSASGTGSVFSYDSEAGGMRE